MESNESSASFSPQAVCDNCNASTYCSHLRLALTVLGKSLAQAPNATTAMRYREILDELALAGWCYPDSHHLCRFSEHKANIKALTDELIALAQTLSAGTMSSPQASPLHAGEADAIECIPSLFGEETSCE